MWGAGTRNVCSVVRSEIEQFENGHFSSAYNLWTSVYTGSEQKITFAKHEYGRVGVFQK